MTTDENQKLIVEIMELVPFFRKNFIRPTEVLPQVDLTPTQMHALFALSQHEELTMSQLCRELFVSKQQMTKVMGPMLEKTYVARLSDPHNLRIVRVRLTDEGRALIARIYMLTVLQLSPRFDTVSQEEKEQLVEAISTLRRIIGKLE